MNKKDITENLEKIIAFEVVARCGSLHRAANELFISQPSLSVKIKTLEENLQTRLLERGNRGVELTESGAYIYKFAQKLLLESQELSLELNQIGEKTEGVMRVGVYESIARYLWPSLYKKLHKKYPLLTMQLTTGRSEYLIDKLQKRELDMVISIEAPKIKDLYSKKLYRDSFSLYGSSKKMKPFKKKTIELDKEVLEGESLICFTDALAARGKALIKEMVDIGLPYSHITEVKSFEIALEFCLEGFGYAILPNRVAKRHFESGKLKQVKIRGLKSLDFSTHDISLTCLNAHKNYSLHQLLMSEFYEMASS